MISKRVFAAATVVVCLAWAATVFASGESPADAEYREFLGLNPRRVVWFLAQLHLMFGAFVLGVPIFGVIIEYVGTRSDNPRFDELAHECARLLSAAYATTAALGGLMSFALFALYPKVMQHISGAMHNSFYIYGLLFFGEAFTLYLYYYSWDRMRSTEPVWPRVARVFKWPAVALAVIVVPLSFYLFFFNSEPAHESQVAFEERIELKRELDAEAAAEAAAAEEGASKKTEAPAATAECGTRGSASRSCSSTASTRGPPAASTCISIWGCC